MNYKESITALLEGLKGIFENKTATEASAIAQASSKPSTIFYTSDTHAIVVGGKVYGRSNQVSADAPFSYLPADVSSPSADPQFDGNHDTIYIQPIKTGSDAGKIKLWWYVNGAWVSTDTLDLVLPTDASDITYDLTATPDLGNGDVQSAIEALDGKVEDLRDEVLGDEWVDMMYGCYGAELWRSAQLYNNIFSGVNVNYRCLIFRVNPGDEFRLRGMSNVQSGGGGRCWGIYNEFPSDIESRTNLQEIFVSGGTNYTTAVHGIDDDVTIPTSGKMLIVMSQYNGDYWDDLRIYKHSTTPLSIADKTGYKIDTWTNDEIITSITLAVGSVVPYWADGTRYGGRGVRLNVKEGDKVLLDTYSPALFGLIFTDENRVVKALYDDRRFDGVWTAPVNGYCYIQDVLYRDCYHYSSAHGHLAYMAHDARKRVTKDGDWYNEFSARIMQECMPIEVNKTGNTQTYIGDGGAYSGANYVSIKEGKFVLIATRIYTYADSVMAGTSLVTASWHNSSATAVQIMSGGSSAYISNGYNWGYRIYLVKVNTTGQTFYQAYWNTSSTEKNHHRIDKAYMHSFDNFADAYQLAEKIVNGEVEVDNFYGVKEKEVDFVKNAIGLQSISDLGYNILDYGATLPIDEDGYKYAKEIYERYKDTPISSWEQLFKNDEKLVYMPMLHFADTVSSNLNQQFSGCYNLICVPPMKIPETTANSKSMYSLFDACYSLKRFEFDMDEYQPKALTATWRNCHSLEYVGALPDSITSYSTGVFTGCESLEKIERLPFLNVTRWEVMQLCPNLRYILITDFGRNLTSWNCSYYWANWGIPNDKHPDARQSLVDSLLTYSYDRVNDPDNLGTAGTTCTITLSANSYAQLTASEIEQITAKGYTLTHP